MAQWLYRYEAKGIQDYILESSRLTEIAGASELVARLANDTDRWLAALSPGTAPQVNAAGVATIAFPDESALQRFAGAWPMFCARTRPGLSVVQAWLPLPDGGSPSPKDMLALFQKLAADRMRPRVALPEPGPLVERAGRTGYAAVRLGANGKGMVDEATDAMLAAHDPLRHELFQERLLAGTALEGRRFAVETAAFGEGYVAVVHADGNNIGDRFRELSFEQGRAFSTKLGEATVEATRAALLEVARRRAWIGDVLPARPVVLGGDDLTIFLRAEDALLFTHALLEAFRTETQKRLREHLPAGFEAGLTASAGIAIVKPAFPYRAAYTLSEQLCRYAKRNVTREHPGPTRAAVAFHRVTTAAVLSWDEILEVELSAGRVNAALTGGPWTLDAGHRRLGALQNLTSLLGARITAKGTLREWMRLAQAGDRLRAVAAWKRMLDLLAQDPKREGQQWSRSLLGALSDLGAQTGWRSDGSTPVGDALAWLAVDPTASLSAPEQRT